MSEKAIEMLKRVAAHREAVGEAVALYPNGSLLPIQIVTSRVVRIERG